MPALERISNIDVVLPVDPEWYPVPREFAYRGGSLLSDFTLVSIFWGAEWLLPPVPRGSYWKKEAPLVGYVTSFLDALVTTEYIGLLAEYSVDDQSIGQGRHGQHFVFNDPVVSVPTRDPDDPPAIPSVSPERVVGQLETWIDRGLLPAPPPNVAYLLLTEPGFACEDPTGLHRSADIAGYHWATPSGIPFILLTPSIAYVTERFRGRHLPEVPSQGERDRLTRQISQALVDTITNPLPLVAPGWSSDQGVGLATACASDPSVSYRGYQVAPFWSCAKSATVPRGDR